MFELILSIIAIILVLYLGRLSVSFGLFYEMTSMLLLFFAMMVTLRCWYLATQWMEAITPLRGPYAAFVAYWCLFLIGCIPLIGAMKVITEDSRPKYPTGLDVPLAFLFGTVAAAIFVCSVMTSLSVILPKVWEPYERSAMLVPIDEIPFKIYRFVEGNVFGVKNGDPSQTPLPTLDKTVADDFEKFWQIKADSKESGEGET